jgi:hypothetical protein
MMGTLSDVFAGDERIEERARFEEKLLSFVADLLQPAMKKRASQVRREANDLLAAWSAYTGRDVSDDLEFRLKMRDYRDLPSEIEGSLSTRL